MEDTSNKTNPHISCNLILLHSRDLLINIHFVISDILAVSKYNMFQKTYEYFEQTLKDVPHDICKKIFISFFEIFCKWSNFMYPVNKTLIQSAKENVTKLTPITKLEHNTENIFRHISQKKFWTDMLNERFFQ